MPTIKIPFSKGLTTSDTEGDWTDFLPVNMIAVPKMVLNAEGYMRNWPAITQAYDTTGLARGAVYNVVDDIVYRVAGEDLTDGQGNALASIGANGGGYAPMSYSTNSTVIVSEGKLKYWADDGTGTKVITELQNWAEGERGTPVITDEWALEFIPNLQRRVEIDPWQPLQGMAISFDVRLVDNQSLQWIIGCRDPDATTCGVYVENGEFFIKFNDTVPTVPISSASVGNNTFNFSGTPAQDFVEPIGVIGCVANENTPKQFLEGFITNLLLIDLNASTSAVLDSRRYTGIVSKIREENDNDPPEIIPPDNNFLADDTNSSEKLNVINTISVVGGTPSVPAISPNIALSPVISTNGTYLLSFTVETSGGNASGFQDTAADPVGVPVTARTLEDSATITVVFRSTDAGSSVNLFTANSSAVFTNISIEKVTHGALVGFTPPDYSLFKEESEVIEEPATDYDIGFVTDVTRNRARYIWVKRDSNTFGVTDLLNEQRPDYLAPFYSSELKAGNVVGVGNWRGYVVVFGRDITEYFNLTGTTDPVYVNVQSLTVRCGIAGVGGKCEFQDSFLLVGSPEFEPTSVFVINQGQYREVATRQIQKILRGYTEEELAEVYVEPVKFDAHDMVIIHLKRDVLVYDAGSSQESPRWSVLRSGLSVNDVYRGKFHINAKNEWTVGDKQANIISQFDFTRSDHVGEPVEFVLSSQMIQSRNNRIFDLEVDSISGRANLAYRLAVSTTFDGLTYGNEKWIDYDTPQNYTRRVLFRRLGYMRNNIGFKLRWITDTPTSISNLRVRVE